MLGFFHRRQINNVVRYLAVDNLAVRAFDEAVLVDAGKSCKRVDQTDVRAFRRFNRADTAIMRWMHVADFEASTLTGQTTRSKSRKTALVSDFRKRVGLIHELRQLRGAEEFTYSRSSRLRVDQILRHDRVDFDRGHTFLDRTFHTQKTDAILIFHQLADRTDTTVTEIVDIVDFTTAIAQLNQHLDHSKDVFLAQNTDSVFCIEVETHVHLHATNSGQVIAFRIEEQRMEHGFSRIHCRRLTRTHHAVDVEQRFLTAFVLVDSQRVADIRTDIDMINIKDVDLINTCVEKRLENLLINFITGFEINLTRCVIDSVFSKVGAKEIVFGCLDELEALFSKLLRGTSSQLLACFENNFTCVGINKIRNDLHALEAFYRVRNAPVVAITRIRNGVVERRQNFFAVHAERHEKRRCWKLAATIDTRIDHVLGIEFDVKP
ncbi:hypothetical protein D3C80_1098970 [compost metagenome]